MDGIKFCKAVKKDSEISHLPVVMLTVTAQPHSVKDKEFMDQLIKVLES